MIELDELYAPLGLRIPEIMLPSADIAPEKFSVIACDQHSAEPEYWEETEKIAGKAPSALRMILPEAWLERPDRPSDQELVANMQKYEADGTLQKIGAGFVYVRRETGAGIRHGMMVAMDLEQYDYVPGNKSLIRATEATVRERLPARIRIRHEATLEMPHVMVLSNDRFNDVSYLMEANLAKLKRVYSFDLMQGGGHVEGYFVNEPKLMQEIAAILYRLQAQSSDGLLFAVGDGNHSLAAAKECWNEKKTELPKADQKDHPMRYALVELVSLYDEGMAFHPIHRLLYHVDPQKVQEEVGFDAAAPISLQTLQPKLDIWLSKHPEAKLEYIHGGEKCRELAAQSPDRLAIVYDTFPRDGFFETVEKNGIFVRKSFSIGNANEKRYYLECRSLRK